MKVLVTLSNILEYGLDTITKNSREDLLAKAKELETNGYELYVTLPDVDGGDTEAPVERNAFQHYSSDLPEPDGFTHKQKSLDLTKQDPVTAPCAYVLQTNEDGNAHEWLCVIHDARSKHAITYGSSDPCLVMDPYGQDWEL